MSERLRESLSALMDDEANELELERLLSQIGDDAELRQTWIRYARIRDALSGQARYTAGLDISTRVRAAMDSDADEPETPQPDRLRESLSALMDDEANELEMQRLLSQIDENAGLRQTWTRYSRVRGALSGQAQSAASLDVSARVRAAIDDGAAKPETSLRERLWRPVASFAVAASVAATVVLGGQQLVQLSGDEYQDRSSYASNVSPVGLVNAVGATPVRASYGTRPVPVLQPATNEAYRQLARQRLKQYSQQHAEQAALNTPQGLIPFARVPRISE